VLRHSCDPVGAESLEGPGPGPDPNPNPNPKARTTVRRAAAARAGAEVIPAAALRLGLFGVATCNGDKYDRCEDS